MATPACELTSPPMVPSAGLNGLRPLRIGLCAFVASLLTSPMLFAEPPAAQAAAEPDLRPIQQALRVDANACFDAATLATSVAVQLKRERINRRLELEIRGNPQGEEGVTIEVRHAGRTAGTRTFPPLTDPCDEVLAALAVAVAMTIDATEHEQLAQKAPVTTTNQPKPEGSANVPARRNERALIGLDVVGLWRVLPGWTAGIAPSAAY
ncbi:MAG TPA: hypothetical protein VIV60_36860, partial [Polyangiaceae bacterium]